MKRNIIHIEEELCNGCGLCTPNCHEGALQIINRKARLVSDLFCDGLGACLGQCPEGAITIVEREAEPYNERKVMETILPKGRNTILAHLKHLRDHNEVDFLNVAIQFLNENNIQNHHDRPAQACGCPGSIPMNFTIDEEQVNEAALKGSDPLNVPSELKQWPVQLHLLNPY